MIEKQPSNPKKQKPISEHPVDSQVDDLQQANIPSSSPKPSPQQSAEFKNYLQVLPKYLICPLCEKLIVRSSTTICEHIFCEVCLLEYFVYLGDCPVCSTVIRQEAYSKNFMVDNMVREFIKEILTENNDTSVEADFMERKAHADKYILAMKLTALHLGEKIDAQDPQGVWRTAKIMKVSNAIQPHDVLSITVKYDGLTKKGTLKGNSHRIAQLGFYTKRETIPKMVKGKIILKDLEDEDCVYSFPVDGKI